MPESRAAFTTASAFLAGQMSPQPSLGASCQHPSVIALQSLSIPVHFAYFIEESMRIGKKLGKLFLIYNSWEMQEGNLFIVTCYVFVVIIVCCVCL